MTALYFSNANTAVDHRQVMCKDSDLTLHKVILGAINWLDLIKNLIFVWLILLCASAALDICFMSFSISIYLKIINQSTYDFFKKNCIITAILSFPTVLFIWKKDKKKKNMVSSQNHTLDWLSRNRCLVLFVLQACNRNVVENIQADWMISQPLFSRDSVCNRRKIAVKWNYKV